MMNLNGGLETWDLIVVGAGPAGISAAINARARNLKVLVLEARDPLWRVKKVPWVDNYLGYSRISGAELADAFAHHFGESGVTLRNERVVRIVPGDSKISVLTEHGMLEAYAVVLAIGIIRATLIPGEEDYIGKGVSYCVQCDGPLFAGKKVALIAYTLEGVDEANSLVQIGADVSYLPLHKEPPEGLNPAIRVVWEAPSVIEGQEAVQALWVESGPMLVDGVFIIREAILPSALVEGLVVEKVHFPVDEHMRTNLPGIYAAGDCTGLPYQIAKAVGQGLVAAMDAARRISRLKIAAQKSQGEVLS